jgi:hypothetical protein
MGYYGRGYLRDSEDVAAPGKPFIREGTQEGRLGRNALEKIFICDSMLGHASLARVGRASNAPARHIVARSKLSLSMM